MKTKSFFLLFAAVLGVSLTSCTSYSYTSRSLAIRPAVMDSRAAGADVQVDFSKRVTATSDAHVLKSDAINDAQYKAIQQYGVDVIVDPIYRIQCNMAHKKAYTVTITGYAGMYNQVPTGIDAMIEKNYKVEDIEKYKLLNDPSFYQYYYQKDPAQGGDVTNYYINSTPSVSTAKASKIISTQPTGKMARVLGMTKGRAHSHKAHNSRRRK